MVFTLIGILSSLVFVAGDIPYFIDTIRRKIKPHRITWGIISLLNIVGFFSQYAAGARNSLWLYGAAIMATTAIFIASLRHGTGGTTKRDFVTVAISFFGIFLWLTLDSPLLSIISNLIAAFVGIYPTIKKAKVDPSSENSTAYLFGSISSLLAGISVGELNLTLLIAPAFGFTIQAYIVFILKKYMKLKDEEIGTPKISVNK